MKLKLLSRITIFLMTKVVRRYGWNDGPRPQGFPPVTFYPFWRFVEGTDGKRIASASLNGSVRGLDAGGSGTVRGPDAQEALACLNGTVSNVETVPTLTRQ